MCEIFIFYFFFFYLTIRGKIYIIIITSVERSADHALPKLRFKKISQNKYTQINANYLNKYICF